jgi:hypothetical protein
VPSSNIQYSLTKLTGFRTKFVQKLVHNAEADAEEAVPLVEVVTDAQQETVTVLTVNGLEETKTKALVTALEACEGVLKVLPQVNYYPWAMS